MQTILRLLEFDSFSFSLFFSFCFAGVRWLVWNFSPMELQSTSDSWNDRGSPRRHERQGKLPSPAPRNLHSRNSCTSKFATLTQWGQRWGRDKNKQCSEHGWQLFLTNAFFMSAKKRKVAQHFPFREAASLEPLSIGFPTSCPTDLIVLQILV